MGTDILGRDVLSRFLYGGRSIVVLPTIAVLASGIIGAGLGLWSGFAGGLADRVATRVVDVFFSVPPLLIGILLVAALGSSWLILVGMVILFFVPRIMRVVRGATQATIGQEYVSAAIARGESTLAILTREILPNITGTLLAELAIRLGYAIVWISTFNFLGLGVQPPTADWGLMVSENRNIIVLTPIASLAPALAVALLAIGVNLCADQIASHLARNVLRETRL
jgi:peptide/nickel transport system permease protein